jgi:endonuclease YncB( thermonuclease family)
MEVDIDLGFTIRQKMYIRLLKVDTPESYGVETPAGQYVTRQVVDFFGDTKNLVLHSKKVKVDSFRRYLCNVWVDNRCLNEWLLDNDLAWPTDKYGKIIGKRSVFDLNLPEGIIQKCRENLT